LAIDLFEDDLDQPGEQTTRKIKQPSVMSRRKQQQLAMETTKKMDKYDVEKELAIETIEELGDAGSLDFSGKVRMQCARLRFENDCS
jgi:hypothetical protein